MANAVKPVPEGHHTVTPYLAVKNAAKALEFYTRVSGLLAQGGALNAAGANRVRGPLMATVFIGFPRAPS